VGTAHRLSFPAPIRAAQLGVIGRLACEARGADLFLDLRARIDAEFETDVIIGSRRSTLRLLRP
jgi:hypothetical protein